MLRFVMFTMFLAVIVWGGAGAMSAAAQANTATQNSGDVAETVICNVIGFVQRLGLPIMTGVILGSSIMAIFGKVSWPAIVMLVVFTGIFFGAGKLMQKFAAGVNSEIAGKDASSWVCKGGSASK